MNIFIRAYGSHLMGMGHLYRVNKIVNKLKKIKQCNITLFTQKYSEAINIYKDINVDDIIEIPINISIEDEAKELEKAFEIQYEICINDQLNTDKLLAEILTINSNKSITFDDLGNGNYLFNHIINVLYPSKNRLKNEINSYNYMILDDYSKIKENTEFKKDVKTIFINQGAADTWGAIPDMINDLNKLNIDFKIKVLLGPSFKHWSELSVALENNTKQIEIFNYTKSVIELAKDCDLAILGAGNTLFEIASIGVPIIASTREQKELITIERLLNDDIVYSNNCLYSNGLDVIVKRVIEILEDREKKYINNRKLFQYNGLDKIIRLIDGE